MALINTPPVSEEIKGLVSPAWSAWVGQVFRGVLSVYQSGTTAQRPTQGLWVGRRYFDTELGANGKPIWVDKTGVTWVLADGSAA